MISLNKDEYEKIYQIYDKHKPFKDLTDVIETIISNKVTVEKERILTKVDKCEGNFVDNIFVVRLTDIENIINEKDKEK